MLPEANEVCVARREAHEPLLVLDHGVEEVADGEVPAVRRPEDLSRTIIAGDQDNRGPVVSDEAVEFVAAQGRGAPPLEPALVKLRVARGEVAVRLLTGGAERVSALEISPVVPHEFSNTPGLDPPHEVPRDGFVGEPFRRPPRPPRRPHRREAEVLKRSNLLAPPIN